MARGEASLVDASGNLQSLGELDFSALAARPFLKWTGGKQWLAPLARQLMPRGFTGTYFEPFLGAGALFFSLSPNRAVLGDLNEELVSTFEAVRDDPSRVISLLSKYPHDREFYDALRRARPRAAHRRAARLIYLNKTAFNGIYRVNRDGVFNVPFGRYVRPSICQADRINEASAVLRNASARLVAGDFAEICRTAGAGDLVYLDPPYITGHQNNGFRKYNARLFAWPDQERLADEAARLSKLGARVLISNADHPAVTGMYGRGWRVLQVERNSLVNSSVAGRGIVGEVLISNYRLPGLP